MSTFNIFCHAALMIGAWMWLIPTGILTAVYKKRFGPGWIKLHMPLQVRGYSKGGGGAFNGPAGAVEPRVPHVRCREARVCRDAQLLGWSTEQ